jgi:hypothetical protein
LSTTVGCHHYGYEGSFDEQQLRMHNKRMQQQLETLKASCNRLEQQYGQARDELAHTKATYNSQFQHRLTETQNLVRKQQQDDEQIQNANLLEEFNQLEQYQTQIEMLENAQKESQQQQVQRQATSQRERKQLFVQNQELQTKLEEAQRRVEWLEQQLQQQQQQQQLLAAQQAATAYDSDDDGYENNARNTTSTTSNNNSELLSQSRIIQEQLEQSIIELKQDQEMENMLQCRQILEWKQRSRQYQQELELAQRQLSNQQAMRDSYRLEWARRIEQLELTNQELEQHLKSKEEQHTHKLRLQQRAIESLEAQLANYNNNNSKQREAADWKQQEQHQSSSAHHPRTSTTTAATTTLDQSSIIHNTNNNNNTKEQQQQDKGYTTEATEDTSSDGSKAEPEELEEARARERLVQQQLDDMTEACALAQKRTLEAERRVELL